MRRELIPFENPADKIVHLYVAEDGFIRGVIAESERKQASEADVQSFLRHSLFDQVSVSREEQIDRYVKKVGKTVARNSVAEDPYVVFLVIGRTDKVAEFNALKFRL